MKQKILPRKNLLILGLGAGLLILGYYLMGQGPHDSFLSLTLSPIVLVIAYLVVIPLGLIIGGKEKLDNTSGD